jgi:hypothetical protein
MPANGYIVLLQSEVVAQNVELAKFPETLFQGCQSDDAVPDAVILVSSLQDEPVPELGNVEALQSDIRLLSEIPKRTLLLRGSQGA